MKMIGKLTSWYFTRKALPYWCIILMDCAIILFSAVLSYYFCNGGGSVISRFWRIVLSTICCLPLYMIGMRIFHTYQGVLRYSSFVDLFRVSCAVITGTILSSILIWVVTNLTNSKLLMHLSVTVTIWSAAFAMLGMWALRMIVKYLFDTCYVDDKVPHVFIYGVKEGGISIAKSIRNEHPAPYLVKGFIGDAADSMQGKYLLGIKVYQKDDNIIANMKAARVKILLVSPLMGEAFREDEQFQNELIESGIKIMMVPGAQDWDGNTELQHSQLREVDIEDLLPREKIEVDMVAIGKLLNGKRILITGAAGSIGAEMVRQIVCFEPEELILIDQAETPMHDVRLWLSENHPEIKAHTIVSSILNKTKMEKIFSEHKPTYVFHAAAYKHVPMMENNPSEAVQNNVYGTRIIADLAVKYGTEKFVMISTDKAVNPTNVMGCSKRICEIYCQALNANQTTTQFITTRFGNVLGSNGSVIPIFRQQIKAGGPVTVTHPDIIRFFMLIPEACQLVLEAGTMGKGGEIFVFDMGKPVRIADLAKRMIQFSGAKNVEIKYTGLREGEKLYEEVLNDSEKTNPTIHKKIKIAKVREYPYSEALKNEEELYQLSFTYDDMAIVKKMKEIVPEYKSQHSKYEVLDK